MNFYEVNAAYTRTVEKYLGLGWVINCGTMGGTQGEIARVDVTDGEHIVRILMDEGSEKVDGLYLRYIDILAGDITGDGSPIANKYGGLQTRHFDDDTPIWESERFYAICNPEGLSEWCWTWFGTLEEAKAAATLRNQRSRRLDGVGRSYQTLEFAGAKEIAAKHLRRFFHKSGRRAPRVDISKLTVYKMFLKGRAHYGYRYKDSNYDFAVRV